MKKVMRSLALILCMSLIITGFNLQAAAETEQLQTAFPAYSVEMRAGEQKTVSIAFQNTEDTPEEEVKNLIVTPNVDNTPFVAVTPVITQAVIAGGGFCTANIVLKANNTAAKGNYTVIVNYSYKDSTDTEVEGSINIYINVTETLQGPELILSNSGVPNVKVGEQFELKFDVRNSGQLSAISTKIKLDGVGKDTFVPVAGTNTLISVGTLHAYGIYTAKFMLMPVDTLTSGTYEIPVSFTYLDEAGESYSESVILYVNVAGGMQENTAPRIHVSTAVATIEMEAGQTKTVQLPVKNSGSAAAKDIVVTANLEELPFSSAKNIYRAASLEVSATSNATIDIKADNSATSGLYSVPVDFSYYDEAGIVYSGTYRVYVLVKAGKTAPKLSISKSNILDVKAGDTFKIDYSIINEGEMTAYDVRVKLQGISKDSFIPTQAGANSKIISKIDGSASEKLSLELTAVDAIETDIYELPIEISYTDMDKKEYTISDVIYVKAISTQGNTSNDGLKIKSALQDVSIINAGSDFNVVIVLDNKSGAVTNVRAKIEGFSSTTFIPTDKVDYKQVSKVDANSTYTIKFPITVSENISEGMAELNLSVEYTGADGIVYTETTKIYITNIKNSANPSNDKGVPKMVIKDFSVGEDIVKAGNSFSFSFKAQNTSDSVAIKNMRIKINSVDGIFSIVQGGNTIYYENIDKKQTIEGNILLKVLPEAMSRSYALELSFEYEYADGTPYSYSEVIYVPVIENPRAEISAVSVNSNISVGNIEYAIFQIQNKGKSTIYNAVAFIECNYLEAVTKEVFIGNLEAGKGNEYEIEFAGLMSGSDGGNIVLNYEDSAGNVYEERYFFEMYVEEIPFDPYIPDVPVFDDSEDKVKEPILPIPVIIIIEIVILIASAVITYKIFVSIARKKAMNSER